MDNPQIAHHIAILKSRRSDEIRTAAKALGKIGDASAVPALVEATQSKHAFFVYQSVAQALGKIGVAAVPALVGALKFENGYSQLAAAKALGQTGATSAVPALIETLKDRNCWVRVQAVEAFSAQLA